MVLITFVGTFYLLKEEEVGHSLRLTDLDAKAQESLASDHMEE